LKKYVFFDGFDDSRNRVIPEHKLREIVNFDKTALSLDRTTFSRGGRPEMSFMDPRLPQVGKTTSKTAQ
jgi:hypothetical protein